MSEVIVATINGVTVHSTKKVSRIENDRITFEDGSWCNTTTKQVVNNGSGSLSLGASSGASASGDTKKTGPKSFSGNVIDISGVSADVEIAVGNDMTISVEGPESEVDAIRLAFREEGLFVTGSDSRNSGSNNISISGRGGVFISNSFGGSSVVIQGAGNVISMSSDGASSTKILVTLPKGKEVRLSGINGRVDIGDTEGPVQISLQGGHDCRIGRVGDASLSRQGGGDIEVSHVTGSLTVRLQGSGDVDINDGAVTQLSATIQGSGDIAFGGKAEDATLSIQGSGDIDVAHVTNRPSVRVQGSGDVKVSNWR